MYGIPFLHRIILHLSDLTSLPFSLELQKSTEKVQQITNQLDHLLQNLNDITEKLEALCGLESLSIYDGNSLESSAATATTNSNTYDRSFQLDILKILIKCYEEQTALNRTITENIGTSSTLEQTVYYACIWTHQPAIGQECFIAERQLALMLQM